MEIKKKIHCPTCKKEVIWTQENPSRPFCCERCKLIDLGAWAGGDNAIPGEDVNPYPDEENEL
jgi:endogenous inhibitor of DNA gyrase (YacG/DUF329 family)